MLARHIKKRLNFHLVQDIFVLVKFCLTTSTILQIAESPQGELLACSPFNYTQPDGTQNILPALTVQGLCQPTLETIITSLSMTLVIVLTAVVFAICALIYRLHIHLRVARAFAVSLITVAACMQILFIATVVTLAVQPPQFVCPLPDHLSYDLCYENATFTFPNPSMQVKCSGDCVLDCAASCGHATPIEFITMSLSAQMAYVYLYYLCVRIAQKRGSNQQSTTELQEQLVHVHEL
eukprot:TRINITY_DN8144_c0_g1_i1.p2 TRINITY_DN8144_c0_g1~~TRINITY_DN8144_c0_g1_i1.p2  ORF type:complete len:237 (+),score=19.73 TRINITY_DN8144_c0_g1_i1:97-807(+)